MVSLADSVAPKALYPFFLGRGNKEVGPLLKKTENRQYRAGPEKTENRFRNPVQDTKRLGFPSWMKTWILVSRHEKPGQPEQRITEQEYLFEPCRTSGISEINILNIIQLAT